MKVTEDKVLVVVVAFSSGFDSPKEKVGLEALLSVLVLPAPNTIPPLVPN